MNKENSNGKTAEELKELEDEEELSLDDMGEVSGGTGAFNKVPRVPTRKIDDNLKKKI